MVVGFGGTIAFCMGIVCNLEIYGGGGEKGKEVLQWGQSEGKSSHQLETNVGKIQCLRGIGQINGVIHGSICGELCRG